MYLSHIPKRTIVLYVLLIGFYLHAGSTDHSKLPYIKQSVPEPEREHFQNTLKDVKKALLWGDDSTAFDVLFTLDPQERLAAIYQTIISADLLKKLKKYSASDSILNQALDWVQTKNWRQYIYLKRWRLYLIDSSLFNDREAFLRKLLEVRPHKTVRRPIIAELLKVLQEKKSKDNIDGLLAEMFSGDYLNPILEDVYAEYGTFDLKNIRSFAAEKGFVQFEASQGKYTQAIQRCADLLRHFKNKSQHNILKRLAAEYYYKMGKYDTALKKYKYHLKKFGKTPKTYLQIARCYREMGNTNKAGFWYDKLIDHYPNHRKTEEIYWFRGWDAEGEKNYRRAMAYYENILPAFEGQKRGRWVKFRVAYCLFKDEKYVLAMEKFTEATQQKTNGMEIPAAYYWLAITNEKLGRKKEAREGYLELIEKFPLNFYAHRAQDKLKSSGRWKSEWDSLTRFNRMTDEEVRLWMKNGFKKYKDYNQNAIESAYLSINELLELQLDTAAQITFEISYAKHKHNPWFLYNYAKIFRTSWGEKSYRLALRINHQIPMDKWGNVPLAVLELMYPRPFRGHVMSHAKNRKLEENFVFSLMKQESGFVEDIRSPAGAIGLMQIMPYTGRDLAKKTGLENFKAFDLTRSSTNIFLGTYYLQELLKTYDNNYMLVLGNYNAGPGPTKRWQKIYNSEPLDIFYEEVSYWETRDYIKRVMGNYWNYSLIYQD